MFCYSKSGPTSLVKRVHEKYLPYYLMGITKKVHLILLEQ